MIKMLIVFVILAASSFAFANPPLGIEGVLDSDILSPDLDPTQLSCSDGNGTLKTVNTYQKYVLTMKKVPTRGGGFKFVPIYAWRMTTHLECDCNVGYDHPVDESGNLNERVCIPIPFLA